MADVNQFVISGKVSGVRRVTFGNNGSKALLTIQVMGRKFQDGEFVDHPSMVQVDVFNRGENGQQVERALGLKKGTTVVLQGQVRSSQSQDGEKMFVNLSVNDITVVAAAQGSATSSTIANGISNGQQPRHQQEDVGQDEGNEQDIPF